MNNLPKPTAAERNAAVLAVLKAAERPLSPSEIASRVNQPWCCDGNYPKTSAISPVCARIHAVQADCEQFGFGKWLKPVE